MFEFPHGFYLYLPYPLASDGKMPSYFFEGIVSIKANIKKGRVIGGIGKLKGCWGNTHLGRLFCLPWDKTLPSLYIHITQKM